MLHISRTELIINPDNSVYHLGIKPREVSETIITVGDPDRIDNFLPHFSSVEMDLSRREFRTVTGICNHKRLTVISTGIGTDNVDIVLNELDALFNVDFTTRLPKEKLTSLTIIRVGTSGTIQNDIPIGSFIVSAAAIGLDGLMHSYERDNFAAREWERDLIAFAKMQEFPLQPYITFANSQALNTFLPHGFQPGITVTANGFYAPQGRQIRAKAAFPNLIEKLSHFHRSTFRVTNLEMETAGIYGLAEVLGHKAISLNAILANRVTGEFADNPTAVVDELIAKTLAVVTS
ncbi:MAG: nucleoside phosphorylase [Schleiferiaceae bacterium]|nr:nucleoside phosphorylase [Schleiferiaceae bacterium]